jgi:hypothetical protein
MTTKPDPRNAVLLLRNGQFAAGTVQTVVTTTAGSIYTMSVPPTDQTADLNVKVEQVLRIPAFGIRRASA